MKKGQLLLAAAALASANTPAMASSSDYGKITGLMGFSNGAVLFTVDAPRTAPPSCQYSLVPKRWALDATTVAGQAQVAVLLNAHAMGKRISISGIHSCTVWGDTETVWFFSVED